MSERSGDRDKQGTKGRGFQGMMYKFVAWFLRVVTHHVKVPSQEQFTSPAVYVCHHQNMKGPLLTMMWLPIPLHTWVLATFLEPKLIKEHYANYTFSKRFGWPMPLARLVAWLVSVPLAALMRSMGAISVHRGENAAKALQTLRDTVAALERGESVIIYPDIQYDDERDSIGDMYKGFLLVERMYYGRTKRHIPFVPLRYRADKHEILMAEPIYFPDGRFDDNIDGIYREIQDSINHMAE